MLLGFLKILPIRRLLNALGHKNTLDALTELERRRTLWQEYRRWLADFPDIALALDNMDAEFRGSSLCASHLCIASSQSTWAVGCLGTA